MTLTVPIWVNLSCLDWYLPSSNGIPNLYSFTRSKDSLDDPKFSKWGGLNYSYGSPKVAENGVVRQTTHDFLCNSNYVHTLIVSEI